MNARTLLAGVMAICASSLMGQKTSGPAAWVNPFIGTANEGNVFPGAVLPFGMVAFSPEELSDGEKHGFPPGGYAYDAKLVRGFSLTHLSGAGCAGSGDFIFMPITHPVMESPSLSVNSPAYLSDLSHARERAEPGFYSVRLGNGVLTELTATLRTGWAHFVWPSQGASTLLIRSSDNEVDSSDSSVEIDPVHRTVSGSLSSGDFCGHSAANFPYYTVYFAAHFDRRFQSYGTWQNDIVLHGGLSAHGGTSLGNMQRSSAPAAGKGSGAYLTFQNGAAVVVRVGISYVSKANAEQNLRAEAPEESSFASVRAHATAAWDAALRRIEVHGGSAQQKTVFYTALYHSLLHMNVASDVDGEYRGMDQQAHTVHAPRKLQYANFSGWDVYRSQVQLVTLLFPQAGADMAQSLLNQAEQWGCWSRWTHITGAANVMNGDPSATAIASIVAFGGRNFEERAAYESLLQAATVPHEGHRCSRPHLEQWETQQYLTQSSPHDTSVADTLEFAAADFALSQLARDLGDADHESLFLRRAQHWKNLFNPRATPDAGYLQARDRDGTWKSFTPASGDGFVEGTGAQYLWMVPFNEQGLFDLLGGREEASRRLDAFFHDAQGRWALTGRTEHAGMDNEPSIAVPWLYDFTGSPYKTQETVRAVMERLWNATPAGVPGNDDLGEMSSWYVWAALGMYPAMPGRGELVLSTPLFSSIIVHRGKASVRIVARECCHGQGYVQGLHVDGRVWARPWLPADFVRTGGDLEYRLSSTPDKTWGSKSDSAPPSFDLP